MKRLTASILALGLAASIGTASAQSSRYYQPTVDRYGQNANAYDYARVLRVNPVIVSGVGQGYGTANSQRCYTQQNTYAGNDGYYGNGGYNNGSYGNNGYSNNGYSNNGYSNNGGYNNNGYNNNGYGNDGYYGNQANGSNTGRTMATVIGGVLGAAIGSQVGGGSARYATSAIGSMVGGIAGRQVYENSQRQRQGNGTVQVCDPVPVDGRGYATSGGYAGNNSRVTAYDVTYEYAGRQYTTRTNYNPGDRIRVRVDVRPE